MNQSSAADRCRGLLLGLAAGDRIGGPVRMALRVAESLAQIGRFDAADVMGRYLAWWREGAFDTGPISGRVLEWVSAGMLAEDAVRRVHDEASGMTAGCNPAHRISPLAMCAAIADDDLAEHAKCDARLTHFDPLAGHVAAAMCRVCRALIRGETWERAVCHASEFVDAGPLHSGGFAPDVLRAASHFVGSATQFAEALNRSLAFAGPANYCPVLVGAIAGARWGASAIPASALGHMEILPRIRDAADRLATGWIA